MVKPNKESLTGRTKFYGNLLEVQKEIPYEILTEDFSEIGDIKKHYDDACYINPDAIISVQDDYLVDGEGTIFPYCTINLKDGSMYFAPDFWYIIANAQAEGEK